MVDWCKWLCLSLKQAKDEDEQVQVLHTLAILLYNYGHFEGVISQFNQSFNFGKFGTNPAILYAEGILMFSFLQSGTSSHDKEIEAFLATHGKQMDENPYFCGSLVSAYVQRCPESEGVREIIRHAARPQKCVANMSRLLLEYDEKSFRNVRHSESLCLS